MDTIPVIKNFEYEVVIESQSSSGDGVTHINGFTLFVPDTVEGDRVLVKVIKIKPSFGYAKLINIINPSIWRVESPCKYSKRCGGCQMMHIAYDKQLEIKTAIVKDALTRIGGFEHVNVEKCIGMQTPFRYRNKMIFPVEATKDKGIVFGFYSQRSHDIVALDDCLIGDIRAAKIANALIEYMNEAKVSAYDEISGTGIIRRLFVRTSLSDKSVMAVVSANANKLPNTDLLISKILKAANETASIILNINKVKTNTVLGDKNVLLWGKESIKDEIDGVLFTISPNSFFQVNPVQTRNLYNKALELADISKSDTVWDIYCGIGTISLCAAKKAKEVIGIEIVNEAIADAKNNAQMNKIDNATFFCGDAGQVMQNLADEGKRADIVILDPPRKGADEKTLESIIKTQPKRIVYVSCNPSTLARDLAYLCNNGYEMKAVHPFDMFPNTVHVETVVLMTKVEKEQA